jgi:hypothetical protein
MPAAILTFLSMMIAIFQVGKEVYPVVKPLVTQTLSQSSPLVYRYNDDNHAYYSDNTGKVWGRVDRKGVVEYAYNPTLIR